MIDTIQVVVSPLYSYLKVESYYAFESYVPKEQISFYHTQYYLIKDSSENRRLVEEMFSKRGITIRYSYENWPSLESSAWQELNKIKKY